ncbi:MAG: ribonucleotide-diphosphate reductase subunit beta [Sulfobacillus sp.]
MEPLLDPTNDRLTAYPLRFPDIWQMYKLQRAASWEVEDVDLSEDRSDFQKLSPGEQRFLKYVIAFFAASDGLVNMNLAENFIREVTPFEAKAAYRFQSSMEDVHNEMYSLILEVLIQDSAERAELFRAIENFPSIRRKGEWARKWMDARQNFDVRLLAFAIVEGVFFSASFCAIFWIKTKNLLPGLCQSNEYIARDEGMHTEFACLLFGHLQARPPFEQVSQMFMEAVSLEKEFVRDALPQPLPSMNAESMGEYVEYVADRLLVSLGYPKVFRAKNSFPFMELISLDGKANFFERKSSQYQRANVLNQSERKTEFTELSDF